MIELKAALPHLVTDYIFYDHWPIFNLDPDKGLATCCSVSLLF